MSEESVITEEMRRLIGVESEPTIYEVEKGGIRKFAHAIDDPNPLYSDPDAAKQTKYGGIVCPPTYFGDPVKAGREMQRIESPFHRRLNGGTEYEFVKPIYAGDTLNATTKLVDLYEKQGRPGIGHMLFTVYETTYKNQKGEAVLRMKQTGITYEGPKPKGGQ